MKSVPKILFIITSALGIAWLGATANARAVFTRTLYVGAVDNKGAPVTDLTAADFAVKEGGKDQKIASFQPAAGPMQVGLIVDDGGTGAFQNPTLQFLNKMLPAGQFSIRLVNTQAIKIQDYTADPELLKTALGKMGQRGRVQPDDDQLIEAIGEVAKELQQRKAERPVIVVFSVYGGDHQAVEPENVLSQLRTSGASLSVMYVTGAKTGQVIGDGPKQSGGRIEQVLTGPALPAAAMKIADSLMHQYAMTYTLPDGVKPSDRVSVTLNRKGLTLFAPTRVPDK